MAQAKTGDTVRVHYTGKLNDGTIFDSSLQRDPIEFTIGKGQIIPGFEQAVIGMDIGESKTAVIPAELAYGNRLEEMVLEIGRDQLPAHIQPAVGEHLQITQPDGHSIVVKVIEVTESTVKLDANHPLAGKELTFDIQLVEIL